MTSQELSTILRLQTSTSGELELSPCDLLARGRSIPMLWYYRDVLDTDRLKTSLLQTLEHFPVLCGRSVCINLFKSSLYLYFGLHVQSTSTSCLVYVWLGPYLSCSYILVPRLWRTVCITNRLQNNWIDWTAWIGHLILRFLTCFSKNKTRIRTLKRGIPRSLLNLNMQMFRN